MAAEHERRSLRWRILLQPVLVQTNAQAVEFVHLMRIDSRTELVIAVDIAKRLGVSPQRVYVLAGRHGFPKPVGILGRSAVWRWSSVARWARETGRLADDTAA